MRDRAEAAAAIRAARLAVPPTRSHEEDRADLETLAAAVESNDPPGRDEAADELERLAGRMDGELVAEMHRLAAEVRGPFRAP